MNRLVNSFYRNNIKIRIKTIRHKRINPTAEPQTGINKAVPSLES